MVRSFTMTSCFSYLWVCYWRRPLPWLPFLTLMSSRDSTTWIAPTAEASPLELAAWHSYDPSSSLVRGEIWQENKQTKKKRTESGMLIGWLIRKLGAAVTGVEDAPEPSRWPRASPVLLGSGSPGCHGLRAAAPSSSCHRGPEAGHTHLHHLHHYFYYLLIDCYVLGKTWKQSCQQECGHGHGQSTSPFLYTRTVQYFSGCYGETDASASSLNIPDKTAKAVCPCSLWLPPVCWLEAGHIPIWHFSVQVQLQSSYFSTHLLDIILLTIFHYYFIHYLLFTVTILCGLCIVNAMFFVCFCLLDTIVSFQGYKK